MMVSADTLPGLTLPAAARFAEPVIAAVPAVTDVDVMLPPACSNAEPVTVCAALTVDEILPPAVRVAFLPAVIELLVMLFAALMEAFVPAFAPVPEMLPVEI